MPFDYIMLTPQVTYFRVVNTARLSNLYLRQMFDSFSFQSVLHARAGGGTRAYIGITTQLQLPVIVPPSLHEQQAIAKALSDADALIESLEQLLAKKRQIKQGAMQELLIGKRRLPGFEEDWQPKRLDELAEIGSGGTPSTTQPAFWDGGILWCTPTDITALAGGKYLSTTTRTISPLGLKSSSAEVIPANSVVMTSRATIGECAINLLPVTTNQGFKNFVPLSRTNVEFLYYLLLMQKDKFIALCGGSTFLEIGKTQLGRFEVIVPPTEREQAEISEVLSAMDDDIALLRLKLQKARQIKEAMMQNLLTGRIRLVDAKTPDDLQLV
jgi:type I restriction enzyme S subunit